MRIPHISNSDHAPRFDVKLTTTGTKSANQEPVQISRKGRGSFHFRKERGLYTDSPFLQYTKETPFQSHLMVFGPCERSNKFLCARLSTES
jgi:hypothetical protein